MFVQQKKTPNSANPLDPNRLSNDHPDGFQMSVLVSKTGVSPRQIRYWISIGAVDRPVGRSRAARYSNSHAQQVMQVQERLVHGERLQAITHRRHSNPGQMSEESEVEGLESDGTLPLKASLWHRIEITDNLYIYARMSRSNLERQISNKMKRVAKSMLENAKRPKSK